MKINRQHIWQLNTIYFFTYGAIYVMNLSGVGIGIDPGVSRLGGEIVSHNTTVARQINWQRKLQLDTTSFHRWRHNRQAYFWCG